MQKHDHRLVLACVVLATEFVRLATQILALVSTAINYPDESEMVNEIPA